MTKLVEFFWTIEVNMEEVKLFGAQALIEAAKICELDKTALTRIGDELFSDKINIARIAFFFALAEKLVELYPDTKTDVYEKVFTCVYKNIRF